MSNRLLFFGLIYNNSLLYLSGQSSPSPALSLHPSDSISQANVAKHDSGSHVSLSCLRPGTHVSLAPPPVSYAVQTRPAVRPPQYPIEVLWNLEDCQKDMDVNIQESNKSRPSMDRAIRHPDGTMISNSEWSAIRSSARRIANELRSLPDSGTSRQARMQRTKMYYRTHHPRDWTAAIMRLETEQPLLKLCSSNWKADHILGNSIQAMRTREKGKKDLKGKRKGKQKAVNNDDNDGASSAGDDDSGNGPRGGVKPSGSSKLFYYHESSTSYYIIFFTGDAATGTSRRMTSMTMTTPPLQTNSMASGSEFIYFIIMTIINLMKNFIGEYSSRLRSPPPQTTTDVSMVSVTTGTSSMKRRGPSSTHSGNKRTAKKFRGEQDSGKATQINWMAPLTSSESIPSAKPTTATTSLQDPYAFIHVESSCMYYYTYHWQL